MGRCYVIPGFRGWLAELENDLKTIGKLIGTAHVYGEFRPLAPRGMPKNVVCPPLNWWAPGESNPEPAD